MMSKSVFRSTNSTKKRQTLIRIEGLLDEQVNSGRDMLLRHEASLLGVVAAPNAHVSKRFENIGKVLVGNEKDHNALVIMIFFPEGQDNSSGSVPCC